MRLLHIITGLTTGGAELMLARLAPRLGGEFQQRVICLNPYGPVAETLGHSGIEVITLDLESAWGGPLAMVRLARMIKKFQPDIVQTWLYHADLLGGLAARSVGVRRVIWNIRNNDISSKKTKLATRWIVAACSTLSGLIPSHIVCCAQTAADTHIARGYPPKKFSIIGNGFDLQRLYPDAAARIQVRAELNIPWQAPLLGLIARYDPQKNHAGFIRAAALIKAQVPAAHFLLAGPDVDAANTVLTGQISAEGLTACVRLLGMRSDIPRLNQALDIAVSSSSYGEAFPNVLAEAMACGVPVVSTDAGDASTIVGRAGRIVPKENMAALAAACVELLSLDAAERAALGEAGRRRIAEHFELDVIATKYRELYRGVLDQENLALATRGKVAGLG